MYRYIFLQDCITLFLSPCKDVAHSFRKVPTTFVYSGNWRTGNFSVSTEEDLPKAPNMYCYLEGAFFRNFKITEGFIENDLSLHYRKRKQDSVTSKRNYCKNYEGYKRGSEINFYFLLTVEQVILLASMFWS